MQQFGKRQKELARIQHQREKAERKAARKTEKAARPARAEGEEDPDIAGIVPGPQPLPWAEFAGIEPEPEKEEEEEQEEGEASS